MVPAMKGVDLEGFLGRGFAAELRMGYERRKIKILAQAVGRMEVITCSDVEDRRGDSC